MSKAARPLSWEEITRMETVCYENKWYRDWLLIVFTCSTGYRFCEWSSLRWADVLGRDRVSIIITKQRGISREMLLPLKVRSALIEVWTYDVFLKHPPSRRDNPELKQNFLFPDKSRNSKGTPLTEGGAIRVIRRIARAAGVNDDIATHSLRKAWAIRSFEKMGRTEEAMLTICSWMKHKDPATTRRYLGFTEQLKHEVSDTLWE